MLKKISVFLPLLAVILLLASGCTLPWKKKAPLDEPSSVPEEEVSAATPGASNTGQLKKFDNYAQLAEFLLANANPEAAYNDLAIRGLAYDDTGTMKGSRPASEAAGTAQPNNSLDYSLTNNQVDGVDEPDILKTDGRYIYAVVRDELLVIKSAPAEQLAVISRLTLPARPQDILLNGHFLAAFGSDDSIYSQPVYASFRRHNPYTFFKVFDLSDPANPRQVRDLSFEGSYHNARMIGERVYFLTNTYSYYLAEESPVPRLLENGQVLPSRCEGAAKCFAPDVYYFDRPYESYNFLNLTAINIRDNTAPVKSQSFLLASGQNVYVSEKNIYITSTQYLNEYDLEQEVKRELLLGRLSAEDQDKIRQIDAAAAYVLNNHEKKIKVAQILDRYLENLTRSERSEWQAELDGRLKSVWERRARDFEKTVIHKIGINADKLEYLARGEVVGQALNQFSMDEYGDYFRIATTRNQQWSRFSPAPMDSYSNVYVLDGSLKLAGKLENLATTERIYAARFLGDRLYLVTFKQTDPLFVIDLKDPAKPAVLGALKIPGFSNYLHPVDKDGVRLIGLGREAEELPDGNVRIKGLKLSLFDFSDLAQPREVDSYLIGDERSDSIALSDHRAFLFSATKDVLSVPVVLRDENYRPTFGGALVFSLADDGFRLRGRLDHSGGGTYNQSDYWNGYRYYDNTVKRSLYIGDNLFTFSNKYLQAHSLNDLSPVGLVELTAGGGAPAAGLPPAEPVAGTPPAAPGGTGPAEEVDGGEDGAN